MDGVILVVKPGVTKLTAVQQGLEQLRAVGARVLGVVLNEVNPGSHKYGYYYNRYSKYSHYYEKEPTKKKGTKIRDKVLQAKPDTTATPPFGKIKST